MIANKGELVLDLLFKQLGSDSDSTEGEFYRLNPHVYTPVFLEDTNVVLPEIKAPAKQEIKRLWN